MAIIEWGDHFLTGLDDVDRQHQGLVALANHLSEVVDGGSEEIDAAFQKLAWYAQEHFSLEEKLMDEAGLESDSVAGHKKAHTDFVDDLTSMWEARSQHPEMMTKRLLDFLTVWIYKHILITDREMARRIHDKRQTPPPANHFFRPAPPTREDG